MAIIDRSIPIFALILLLILQIGGVHDHVSVAGEHQGTHGVHVHVADVDGHDHARDIDVSLSEQLGAHWSNHLQCMVSSMPALAAAVWVLSFVVQWTRSTPAIHRSERWRPPLRAPPSLR